MEKNNINVMQYRIVCEVHNAEDVHIRTVLINRGNEHLVGPGVPVLVVPIDESWYVVKQWENAIFVDENGKFCALFIYFNFFKVL